MKIISFLFVILFAATSCKKDDQNADLYNLVAQYDSTVNFNWCNDSIACWGDSFTAGPGTWGYPMHMAFDLGRDWILPDWSTAHRDQTIYNGGVSGESSDQILSRYLADTYHRNWDHIFEMGRNDDWGDTAHIMRNIKAAVAAVPHYRFMVLGIILGDNPDEWKGTAHYQYITAFNESLHATFGRHYLDPKVGLQARAAAIPQDSLSLSHGIIPYSLRLDWLHLNDQGYGFEAEDILKVIAPCKIGAQ